MRELARAAGVVLGEPPAEPGLVSGLRALEAGLAREAAPSVVVVAARDATSLAAAQDGGDAWLIGGGRWTAGWRRTWRIEADGAGRRLVPRGSVEPRESGPVVLGSGGPIALPAGAPAEDRLVASLVATGPWSPATTSLLEAWWAAASQALAPDPDGRRPLDVRPATFRVTPDGWQHLDLGLRVPAGVPAEVLGHRAMLVLALDRLLPMRAIPGVAGSATADDLAALLLERAGVPPDPDRPRIALELEAELRLRLLGVGGSPAAARRVVRSAASSTVGAALPGLPVAELSRRAARAADAEAAARAAQELAASAEARAMAADERVAAARGELEAAQESLARVGADHDRLTERVGELTAELALARAASAAAEERAIAAMAAAATSTAAIAIAGHARPGRLRRLWDRLVEPLDLRRLARSGLFDGAWYAAAYPDVAASGIPAPIHFLRYGGHEGRDPGPGFSTGAYLVRYPDVAGTPVIPLLHYVRWGRAEGREISPSPQAPAPPASSHGASAE
ncbi:MAG: hypothetical protein U0869_24225 [Chloroflexota bacterium]